MKGRERLKMMLQYKRKGKVKDDAIKRKGKVKDDAIKGGGKETVRRV